MLAENCSAGTTVLFEMTKAYKNSIWSKRKEYNIDRDSLSEKELEMLSIMQNIESAKKRTPLIPLESTIELYERCDALGGNQNVSVNDFESFLSNKKYLGVGMKTMICILAVITNGSFPPLDEKVAKAAKLKKIHN